MEWKEFNRLVGFFSEICGGFVTGGGDGHQDRSKGVHGFGVCDRLVLYFVKSWVMTDAST